MRCLYMLCFPVNSIYFMQYISYFPSTPVCQLLMVPNTSVMSPYHAHNSDQHEECVHKRQWARNREHDASKCHHANSAAVTALMFASHAKLHNCVIKSLYKVSSRQHLPQMAVFESLLGTWWHIHVKIRFPIKWVLAPPPCPGLHLCVLHCHQHSSQSCNL